MDTITLKEAKIRGSLITTAFLTTKMGFMEFRGELKDLIELTYKSGKHDGWYDCQESFK